MKIKNNEEAYYSILENYAQPLTIKLKDGQEQAGTVLGSITNGALPTPLELNEIATDNDPFSDPSFLYPKVLEIILKTENAVICLPIDQIEQLEPNILYTAENVSISDKDDPLEIFLD